MDPIPTKEWGVRDNLRSLSDGPVDAFGVPKDAGGYWGGECPPGKYMVKKDVATVERLAIAIDVAKSSYKGGLALAAFAAAGANALLPEPILSKGAALGLVAFGTIELGWAVWDVFRATSAADESRNFGCGVVKGLSP